MKSIGYLLLLGVGLVCLLRSDLTPYKLVTKQELREFAVASRSAIVPAAVSAPTSVNSGKWMFDPEYRTALERTTVIGVPEASRRREH